MKKFLLGLLVCMFMAIPVSQAVFFGATDDTASDVDCVDCVDAGDIDLSDDYAWTGSHTFSQGVGIGGAATQELSIIDANFSVGMNITGDDNASITIAADSGGDEDRDAKLIFNEGAADKYTLGFDGSANVLALTTGAALGTTDVFTVSGRDIIFYGGGVFNQDSADVDFRVESDGNANMLFVDSGNNRVGIGTNAPASLLTVYNAAGTFIQATNADAGVTSSDGVVFGVDSGTRAAIWAYEGSFRIYTTAGGNANEKMVFTDAEVVVNDQSNDVDFRVETDDVANAFVVDAGAETVTTNVPLTSAEDLYVGSSATSKSLTLIDTDMANPFTGLADEDAYGWVGISNESNGGLQVTGIGNTADQLGVYLRGLIASTDPTDNVPGVRLVGAKSGGGTSVAALGADETVLDVKNHATTLLIIYGDGDHVVTGSMKAADYYSGDGTQGMTGACADGTALTVKDGLVTACS